MFRMPERDKNLLDCVVELDDGEDFIEVIVPAVLLDDSKSKDIAPAVLLDDSKSKDIAPAVLLDDFGSEDIAPAVLVDDSESEDTADATEPSDYVPGITSASERDHMVKYLIKSYRKDNIFLKKVSYDFSHLQRTLLKKKIRPSHKQSTSAEKTDGDDIMIISDGPPLSKEKTNDNESKLDTIDELTQKQKIISRCIYCSRLVDSLESVGIPKLETILKKWLVSLSEGDQHVEDLLRKRLQLEKTNYVLCNLHYDPKHVASFLMGYRLPWAKLP